MSSAPVCLCLYLGLLPLTTLLSVRFNACYRATWRFALWLYGLEFCALYGRAIIVARDFVCCEKMSPNLKVTKKQCTLLIVSLVSVLCFLVLTFSRSSLGGVNSAVNIWASSIQTEELTYAAKIIDLCFDTYVLLVATLPLAIWLIYKTRIQPGLLILGAMGADAVLLQISKSVVSSPRPLNSIVSESSNSFPSGHLVSTLVFFGMLTYLAFQNRKTILKLSLGILTPALAVFVGLDRLYLNAHWLSDVIAAPFLALFIVTVTILIVESLTQWFRKKHSSFHFFVKGSIGFKSATLYGRANNQQHQT